MQKVDTHPASALIRGSELHSQLVNEQPNVQIRN